MPVEFTALTRLDDLEERRAEWTWLADRTPGLVPFCRPEVWLAWYAAHPGENPSVFELRRGGAVASVLPMVRRGSELRMAADEHLDYQDILAATCSDGRTLIEQVLKTERAQVNVFTFAKVSERSLLAKILKSAEAIDQATHWERAWSPCPTVTISLRRGEDFLASLSGRHRRNHRNADRRLQSAFPSCHATHWKGASIPKEALEAASALHLANQHRKKGPSIFSQRSFRDFLEYQTAADAPLCLSLLRSEPMGTPLAFNLGFFGGDTYHYYLTAYDGRFAELSPGRWLLVETLREAARLVRGDALRFDMLSGEDPYKTRWAVSYYTISRKKLIPKRIDRLPHTAALATVYGLKAAKNWARVRIGLSLCKQLEREHS